MTGAPATASLRWFLVLVAFFAVLCGPLLLTEREGPYTQDEASYYLPAIHQIRNHWPTLDVTADSLSATAPGYHYFLAGISYLTGTGRLPLRVVNFIVSAGVLVLLWRIWPAGMEPRAMLAALLPLAASNFFVKSAAYVVTDNAALLAVTGALVALFFAPPTGAGWRASALAAVAVFIRQSSAWLVAPLAFHALRSDRSAGRWLLPVPPIAVVFWLVLSWGGLVPPRWREVHYGSSSVVPAAGVYLLSVVALLGPFFHLATRPAQWPRPTRGICLGFLAGLALALASPTTPNYDAGRWGGYLWNLAALLPAWGTSSPLFLLLAPLGGTMVALLFARLRETAGTGVASAWLVALLAWSLVGMANRQVFHRYFEPPALVFLICWLALWARARFRPAIMDLRPLLLLATVQLVATVITAHGRTFGFF
jgi:hypothetical protein